MLSTTIIQACPRCQSERLHRNGHTVRGAQRAKCKDCQRTFTLEPKGPRYSPAFKAQALAAVAGPPGSARGHARAFGVCYQTIQAWPGRKMAALPEPTDTRLPGADGGALELDERWTNFGA